MPSYFEYNVSLNGYHLFATAPRSGETWLYDGKVEELGRILREKFPESEGYQITLTFWKCCGHRVNMETGEYKDD